MRYQEIMDWIDSFDFDPNVQYTVIPFYSDPGEHTYENIDMDIVDEEIMYRYTWDKAFMMNNAVMPAVRNAINDPDMYHSIEIWGRNNDADGFDQFLVFRIDTPITDVPSEPDHIEPILLSDEKAVKDWLKSYKYETCTTYSVFAANDIDDGFSYSSLMGEEDEERCVLVNQDDLKNEDDLINCIVFTLTKLSSYYDNVLVYKMDVSPDPDDLDEDDPDVIFFHDALGRTLGAKGTLVKHFIMDIDLAAGNESVDEEDDA